MKQYTLEDLNQIVSLLDGKHAMVQDYAGDPIVLTAKEAFRRALGASYPEEQPGNGQPGISFEKKMLRYSVSKKILECTWTVDLSTEEQAELKKCVGRMYFGEVLGELISIIEATPNNDNSKQPAGNGHLKINN